MGKSSVVISGWGPAHLPTELAHALKVEQVSLREKYLGLPTYVGRSKKEAFAYIEDGLTKKLKGRVGIWKSKMSSAAGREILLKVVAQAMPLYAMTCYLLPQGFCDELHQLCAEFWCGDKDDKKAIIWGHWEEVCKPRIQGGMGFRHLYPFNLAKLAKQEVDMGVGISYSWKSILSLREVLKAGMRSQIGDGLQTKLWTDPWLYGHDLSDYFEPQFSLVAAQANGIAH